MLAIVEVQRSASSSTSRGQALGWQRAEFDRETRSLLKSRRCQGREVVVTYEGGLLKKGTDQVRSEWSERPVREVETRTGRSHCVKTRSSVPPKLWVGKATRQVSP